jgi:hypothetical protein
MDASRTKRGAWRRSPILPSAVTSRGGPTITATAPWAEAQAEMRRLPEPPGGVPSTAAARGEVPAERVRRGGCLCGAVRLETQGRPSLVELCHCADCRKAGGGHAAHHGTWPAGQVSIQGRLAVHAGRSFCPSCGSHVAHVGRHTVTVLLGALDEPPNDLVPERELWTIRREPWAAPIPGAMQFERDAV